MKKVFLSCKINLRAWRTNPKYAAVLIYLFLYLWSNLHGYSAFSEYLGYKVRPWIFGLIPANFCFVVLYIPILLLLSDAPFRTHQQQFVLIRIGTVKWMAGQLLYILVLSVTFTFATWVFSILPMLTRIEWRGGWGPLLTTVATENLHFDFMILGLDYDAMKNTSPLSLTLWTAYMMTAVSFFLGEIMTLCNLWLKKGVGLGITTGLVLMPTLITTIQGSTASVLWLMWISPVSWIRASALKTGIYFLPTMPFAAIAILAADMALGVLCLAGIHRCNVDTEE